jgi:glucose-6-phosphate 1-dehydrogenase
LTVSRSDALVLFGVTGDLAHKMIFPALYAMAKRGTLKVPVIGVASPKWSLADLHNRVKDSLMQSGGIDSQRALDHLLSLLSYVSGDYNDRGTFTAIKKALGSASRPAHYLAIPPSLFKTVIEGLGAAILAEHARVIVEKPFGRDLASARELNRVARLAFPEDSIFRIDHFLGKEAIMNILYFRFANSFLEPGSWTTPWPVMARFSPAKSPSRPRGRSSSQFLRATPLRFPTSGVAGGRKRLMF